MRSTKLAAILLGNEFGSTAARALLAQSIASSGCREPASVGGSAGPSSYPLQQEASGSAVTRGPRR